jgi:mono/diheme cytochrome c family protein
VPSGVPFFVQALDADGLAVQTMRSATYVQPGQTFACIGCHESRVTAPPVRPSATVAAGREPSKLAPGPDGSWPLDYNLLVQPVLDKHCRECHAPGGKDADHDLTAGKSYDTLINYGKPSLRQLVLQRYEHVTPSFGPCAAQSSPLVKLLKRGHYAVHLREDDWDRLVTWIDTYGQRRGAFSPTQENDLRELRRRLASLLGH